MNKPKHLQFLDGFRGAAALFVVFHHAWLQSWAYTLYPEMKPTGLTALLTSWLAFGKVAVTAFIVISGFCLMLPVVRYGKHIEAKQFLVQRCRRILPPYYIALLLALVLDITVIHAHSGTLYDASFPITTMGLLSHLFLVQNFTHGIYEVSGPLWSIAVECQIYCFFPFFIWVYRRNGLAATLALTTILGFTTSYLFNSLGFANTFSHYIVMFGFGMAAAHVTFTLRVDQFELMEKICCVVVPGLLLFAFAVHHELGSSKVVTDTFVGIATAVCLMWATINPKALIARAFSFKPLVSIGVYSYSLYLVHFPIQQILWQWVAHPAGWSRVNSFLFVALIGTPCILFFAFCYFSIFEKPYVAENKDEKQAIAAAWVLT